MSIRTFIAFEIDPGPRLRRVIDQLGQIGSPVRIPDTPNLHMTLKFLGETPADGITELIRILDEVAGESHRIESVLAGLGVFPDQKKPTVVWAGIRNPRPVVTLQQQLERRLEVGGWNPDERVYRPHVTIARVNTRRRPVPGSLFQLLARHAETDFGSFRVDGVSLYQSELSPRGAIHTALHRSPLRGMRPEE